MGLRETKAARRRERMLRGALDLFERDGFEATTMESIAERAEVGTTTLYRYFPSKDLLLLERFAEVFDLAPRLAARPTDEPLEVSLGAVLLETARFVDDPAQEIARVRPFIDASPNARATLWDLFLEARARLTGVVAERLGVDPEDAGARLTAGTALELAQMIDVQAAAAGDGTRVRALEELLEALPASRLVLPLPLPVVAPD